MKLWIFDDTDPAYKIWGRFATFVVVAESEKAAKKQVVKALEDFPGHDVTDYKIREVDLTMEPAGILVREFIGD